MELAFDPPTLDGVLDTVAAVALDAASRTGRDGSVDSELRNRIMANAEVADWTLKLTYSLSYLADVEARLAMLEGLVQRFEVRRDEFGAFEDEVFGGSAALYVAPLLCAYESPSKFIRWMLSRADSNMMYRRLWSQYLESGC